MYSALLKSGGSGKKPSSSQSVSTPHLAQRLAMQFGDIKTPADGTPVLPLPKKPAHRLSGSSSDDSDSDGSSSSLMSHDENEEEEEERRAAPSVIRKLHLPKTAYQVKSSKGVHSQAAKMNRHGTSETLAIRQSSSVLLSRNSEALSHPAASKTTKVQSELFNGSFDPATGAVTLNRRPGSKGVRGEEDEEESEREEAEEEETFEDEEGDF